MQDLHTIYTTNSSIIQIEQETRRNKKCHEIDLVHHADYTGATRQHHTLGNTISGVGLPCLEDLDNEEVGMDHTDNLSEFFLFFFCSPSHILSSPFYSLPPSRHSDPGSRSRLFFPPTHYVRFVPCICIARRFQLFFPRRLASNRVYPRSLLLIGALSSSLVFFFILFYSSIFANKFKISPRRDSNSRINTTNATTSSLPGRPVCLLLRIV